MANSKHLDVLMRGVEAWNKERREHIRFPDLTGVDLSRLDLSGIDLERASLAGATCERTIFRDANLSFANLSKANLVRADFSRASLVETKFGGANLEKATFIAAQLIRAKLDDAVLIDAYFINAQVIKTSLERANLSKANLIQSNFSRSNLTDAVLTDAKLDRADLTAAILTGTQFRNAHFMGTILNSNDLSKSLLLETVRHSGPSVMSFDTLYLSNGLISETFLRGIGLPETLITYTPALTEQVLQFYSCFISYSHTDASFARRLHDNLQGIGIRCWLDEHQLLPGDKIFTEVDRGIRIWDKVLLCCSRASLSSWWVDNEIEIAFEKEQQLWESRGKEVLALIPLNLDGYMFSGEWKSGKASQIRSRLAADFTGWEHDNTKYETQLERVIRALRTRGGRQPDPTPQL